MLALLYRSVQSGPIIDFMQTQPKTRRGRESRDRIIECAATLIADRGVEHVGLDDVPTAAGVGKGQLYHYFADRDALVEAAVARRCAQVQEALADALTDRTAIVIAHRLSTIRAADQILVVEAGRIVERGDHDTLLAAGGRYADLYRTQFANQPAAA